MDYLFFLTSVRELDDAIAEARNKCEEWDRNFPYGSILAVNDKGKKKILADKGDTPPTSVKTIEEAHRLAWEKTLRCIFYWDPMMHDTVKKELEKEPLEKWSRKLIVKLIDLVQDAYGDLLPKLLTGESVVNRARIDYVLALEVLLDIQATKGVAPFAYTEPFPLRPYNWPCYDLRYSLREKGRSIVIIEIDL